MSFTYFTAGCSGLVGERGGKRGKKKNQWESTIPYNMKMQPFLFYTFQIHFEKFSSRAHAVVAACVVV